MARRFWPLKRPLQPPVTSKRPGEHYLHEQGGGESSKVSCILNDFHQTWRARRFLPLTQPLQPPVTSKRLVEHVSKRLKVLVFNYWGSFRKKFPLKLLKRGFLYPSIGYRPLCTAASGGGTKTQPCYFFKTWMKLHKLYNLAKWNRATRAHFWLPLQDLKIRKSIILVCNR